MKQRYLLGTAGVRVAVPLSLGSCLAVGNAYGEPYRLTLASQSAAGLRLPETRDPTQTK